MLFKFVAFSLLKRRSCLTHYTISVYMYYVRRGNQYTMLYVYFPYNKRRHVKICQALRRNRFAANVSEPKTPAITIGLSRQTTVIHSDLSIKRFGFRHKVPLWAGEGINHPGTSHRRVCSACVHVCVTHTDSQPTRRIVHQRQTKIVNCTSVGAIKTSLKH